MNLHISIVTAVAITVTIIAFASASVVGQFRDPHPRIYNRADYITAGLALIGHVAGITAVLSFIWSMV